MPSKPTLKPNNPNFSSGPCAKYPGYTIDVLKNALLGRSHRSPAGKQRLQEAIFKTKELLGIPDSYRVGIVPASDTGAFEMALWNLLGERAVTVIYFESFGKTWANDIKKELQLREVTLCSAAYGSLPDLTKVDFDHDVVFTWNGTTSGVKVPGGDFIPAERRGLTLCDATSAVFAMAMPWDKLDVATFSWQKVLGGEAAHGMLVLSPRAVERIETYSPPWPLPKIFRLKSNNKFLATLFEGSTINTPSLLCTEDYLAALQWAESVGGLPELIRRSESNLELLEEFVSKRDWIHFLAADPAVRSNTSVCLTVDLPPTRLRRLVKLLEDEAVAYDIASYREAPEGLRFWCGATVEKEDLAVALQWLEWAYHKVQSGD